MNESNRRVVFDIHTHIHPMAAEDMRRIMDAAGIEQVVNLGVLEALGIAYEDGMRALRTTFGDRMVYFPTPEFKDLTPGFGERMADELERKIAAGAAG